MPLPAGFLQLPSFTGLPILINRFFGEPGNFRKLCEAHNGRFFVIIGQKMLDVRSVSFPGPWYDTSIAGDMSHWLSDLRPAVYTGQRLV